MGTSVLDYFAYTDRAVGFHVPRTSEFAPVREVRGPHSAERARRALHRLHCSWIKAAGGIFSESDDPDGSIEVSPLLSYEGENLGPSTDESGAVVEWTVEVPSYLACPSEVNASSEEVTIVASEDAADGLDTRAFYMQEYPLR